MIRYLIVNEDLGNVRVRIEGKVTINQVHGYVLRIDGYIHLCYNVDEDTTYFSPKNFTISEDKYVGYHTGHYE